MAADILLYDTDRVPSGDDQRQHLELTRTWRSGSTPATGRRSSCPRPPSRRRAGRPDHGPAGPDQEDVQVERQPQGTIGLFDDPATIERKIKRAVTDTDTGADAVRYDPVAKPGVSNLLELLAAVQGRRPEDVAGDYTQYGPLKADVAAAVISAVQPIQSAYRRWTDDPGAVMKVLQAGAERAGEVAQVTLRRAYDAVGLVAPG